jgi:FMN phosphatase YigB (HAD superfamily)
MQENYNDYMLRRTKEENMKENMKNTNKTILTDCDGVLLDWETSFHNWMADNGYKTIVENVYEMEVAYGIAKSECKRLVREFNNSAWMCCLPALRDSRSGVAKLVEAGYTFICITSMSLDPYAKKLREDNLATVFGEGVFTDVVCLDTGADKDDALAPYKDTGLYWLEDKPENAQLGADLGLTTILINHGHNANYMDKRITNVDNWAQVCDAIL